jgi:hypothetical protein
MKSPKSSIKSVQKTVKGLMQDKNVLYVVAFLAFMNILGYLAKQNGEAIIFFLLVGFLTTYFSKNMIVVLITAMVATNLFVMSRMTFIRKEGMTNSDADAEKDDAEDTRNHHDNEKHPVGASAQAKKKKASLKKAKYENEYENEQQEGLAMPASEAEEEGEEDYATVPSKGGDHIDYSKTLESAYGNLEKILGEGGMKDISKTTQQLMEQQKMLMENMNQMAPMMKAAEGFMDKFGGSNLSGLIGGMLGGNKVK